MSECAALNPDSDVDEDEGQFFYNEDEVMAGVDPHLREAMMDHFDSLLEPPQTDDLQELIADDPGRFDDPDEGDDNVI
jgi:nucleotide-sensitive chloride channel 1A